MKLKSTYAATVEVPATVQVTAVATPVEQRFGAFRIRATSDFSEADAAATLRAFATAILQDIDRPG